MLKNTEQILKLKYYVADCELLQCSVDRQNLRSGLSAQGCAILVSGDVEVEFNWVADGGVSSEGEFIFKVSLDQLDPDFYVTGIDDCAAETLNELCTKIMESCNWQAEVAECLPKNEAELASL